MRRRGIVVRRRCKSPPPFPATSNRLVSKPDTSVTRPLHQSVRVDLQRSKNQPPPPQTTSVTHRSHQCVMPQVLLFCRISAAPPPTAPAPRGPEQRPGSATPYWFRKKLPAPCFPVPGAAPPEAAPTVPRFSAGSRWSGVTAGPPPPLPPQRKSPAPPPPLPPRRAFGLGTHPPPRREARRARRTAGSLVSPAARPTCHPGKVQFPTPGVGGPIVIAGTPKTARRPPIRDGVEPLPRPPG